MNKPETYDLIFVKYFHVFSTNTHVNFRRLFLTTNLSRQPPPQKKAFSLLVPCTIASACYKSGNNNYSKKKNTLRSRKRKKEKIYTSLKGTSYEIR